MSLAFRLSLLLGLLLTPGAAAGAPRELLPDLVARAPWKVAVKTVGREHRLVFASASVNVGEGPLEIVATRPETATPTMAAVQLVHRSDGSTVAREGAGELRYTVSTDHQHWHLLHFMRYEVRRARGGGAVVRDRKTGFCLGDRYDTRRRLRNKPRRAVFRGGCGFREPELVQVREGISVGYGDNYRAELEGQYLRLNGLRAGRYLLVHTVDQDGRLRERTHANNVAWVVLRLAWRGGRPKITLGRSCGQAARCSSPRGR